MDRTKYIEIRNSLKLEKDSSTIAIHFAENILLAASALLMWRYLQDSWMRLMMIFPLFCLMFRGFGIMHDAVHGAVSRTRWINDLAGFLGGTLCMLPYENWKRSHLKHHQWSGNVEKDPVMALIIMYPKFSKTAQYYINFLWMLWFPVLGLFQHFVFWNLSAKLLMKEPKSLKMAVSVILPIVAWGGGAFFYANFVCHWSTAANSAGLFLGGGGREFSSSLAASAVSR